MSEGEPTERWQTAGEAELSASPGRAIHSLPHRTVAPQRVAAPAGPMVSFDRHELRVIFGLYGRKVAAGEWRDYALDFGRDRAVFSIFRRASEIPIYRIHKEPSLAHRQGPYSVIAPAGLIVKRGHDLAKVIAVLDKPLKLVVS